MRCSACNYESADAADFNKVGKKHFCLKCHAEKFKKCSDCGRVHDATHMHLTGTGYLCGGCFPKNYFICHDCGKTFRKNNNRKFEHQVTDENNKQYSICSHCYDKSYTACDCCGNVYKTALMKFGETHRHKKVCTKCLTESYTKCMYCGKFDLKTEMHTFTNETEMFCKKCGSSRFKRCRRCESFINPNDVYENGENSEECLSCNIKYHLIKEYSYKPNPKMKRSDKDSRECNLYYGVEIEFQCGKRNASNSKIYEINGRKGFEHRVYVAHLIKEQFSDIFYSKSDSSIGYGIEMVSHPLSLFAWKDINERINENFKILVNNRCFADEADTCGMHVHASKNDMSSAHSTRLALFVHNNRGNIEKIARRPSNGYSKFVRVDTKRNGNELESYKYLRENEGRYNAVNWSNRNTVEFRIFRSTLVPKYFYTNVEFCDAAVNFSKDISGATLFDSSESWKRFSEFIANNPEKYDNLKNYMTEQKILTA